MKIKVPGSKSITNRALLLAALSDGESVITGCMAGGDGGQFLSSLRELGFTASEEKEEGASAVKNNTVRIMGLGGGIPKKSASVNVGSAGTAARFLAALTAFSDGEYMLDASEQMKKRPMKDLTDVLKEAGAEIEFTEREGYFPMKIKGAGDVPAVMRVNIDSSSQFLSALMIAAGARKKECRIEVEGTHGLAYVEMTAKMMESFGAEVTNAGNAYIIKSSGYKARSYAVEPDMSAAAYFYAASLLNGERYEISGAAEESLQGDEGFRSVLENMRGENGSIHGGMTVDMSAMSDQALTLAVVSAYADAPVTIKGIAHIRLQECDRVAAIRNNLERMGITTAETEDSVTVYPGKPHGAEIESYDDHRVAMSFALAGLRTEGIVIKNKDCVKKTFPEFFEVLKSING
ncbi:MAG: 3-phosphoshikimate 1-carboxyvinyltransferase [Lachnospiraceae bacterium]|nr:3-phosphoshikimate 1-carboxyvinyltransferase [Lachnospiraceae bacterium]